MSSASGRAHIVCRVEALASVTFDTCRGDVRFIQYSLHRRNVSFVTVITVMLYTHARIERHLMSHDSHDSSEKQHDLKWHSALR